MTRPVRLLEDGSAVMRPDIARDVAAIVKWALPQIERRDRIRVRGDLWDAAHVLARAEVVEDVGGSGFGTTSGFVSGDAGDRAGVIDIATAAARRGVSGTYVRRLARDGRIPGARKPAGTWLIPSDWSATR